jgi:hypothetical protein
MNEQTYSLLRRVAKDIRQPALEAGRTAFALEQLRKATAFLAVEVQQHGDVTLAKRADFAKALRDAAAIVEQQSTYSETVEAPGEEALAEDYIEHARNPEYVADALEYAANLIRDGDSETGQGLVILMAGAFKIHKERDQE